MTTKNMKISPPEKLPTEGLTATQFDNWRSALLNFLSQSEDYERFLKGGIYDVWEAFDDNPGRITELHESDTPGEGAAAVATRLSNRRKQLNTTLSHIAGVVNSSMFRSVMRKSTSVASIWEMIETDYDIEKQGRHFLKLDQVHYNPAGAETINAFYRRLRDFFEDNLRKAGEKIKSKKDKVIEVDETLSHTMENTIVYMALREIDARLPAYVDQIYGPRMDNDTTLYDLQSEIFKAIPRLLGEMNTKEGSLGAVNSVPQDEYYPEETPAGQYEYTEPQGAALAATGFNRAPFAPRGGFRPRFSNPRFPATPFRGGQPRFPPQYQGTRMPRPQRYQSPPMTGKYCRLCREAGFPRQVFQNHNLSECNRWTRESVAQIRSMVLDLNINPEDYPEEPVGDQEL